MATGAGAYPEPVIPWLSKSRLRLVAVLVLLAAFYSASWRLAKVDPALAERIQRILVAITDAQAKTILPTHYTGFVAADHGSYKMIEDAGVLVGRIKKK